MLAFPKFLHTENDWISVFLLPYSCFGCSCPWRGQLFLCPLSILAEKGCCLIGNVYEHKKFFTPLKSRFQWCMI